MIELQEFDRRLPGTCGAGTCGSLFSRGKRHGASGPQRVWQKHAFKNCAGASAAFGRADLVRRYALVRTCARAGGAPGGVYGTRAAAFPTSKRGAWCCGRFPYLPFPRRYRKSDHEAVDRALQQADALELAHCRMEELSGGQRQKIYLAMALAQQTKTIFMDEPTTWLDVRHQMEGDAHGQRPGRSGKKQWFWSATTCVLRCARQTGWRFCHRKAGPGGYSAACI